jgi:hypothetical protein
VSARGYARCFVRQRARRRRPGERAGEPDTGSPAAVVPGGSTRSRGETHPRGAAETGRWQGVPWGLVGPSGPRNTYREARTRSRAWRRSRSPGAVHRRCRLQGLCPRDPAQARERLPSGDGPGDWALAALLRDDSARGAGAASETLDRSERLPDQISSEVRSSSQEGGCMTREQFEAARGESRSFSLLVSA